VELALLFFTVFGMLLKLGGLPVGGGLRTAASRKFSNSCVPVTVLGTPHGELKEIL